MSHSLSLRLPEELISDLERVAETTQRTKTYLIRRALETYLKEYADYQVALDRLRDKDDAILTRAELKKKLGF